MAKIKAIQNGNWSDGSTWSSGAVPTLADDVYLNGKTVNIAEDETIIAKSISNYSDDDTSAVQGGCIYATSNDATKSIYIISNVYASGNIVNSMNTINIIGNIEGYTNSTQFVSAILYCRNYTPHHNITGNVTLLSNNIGYLIANVNSQSYTGLTIDGSIIINGGRIYHNGSYNSGITYLNGNISIDGGGQIAQISMTSYYTCVVTGNIEISNGGNLGGCGNATFNGDITIDENSILATNLGNATFNGEIHSYFAQSGYVCCLARNLSNPVFNGGLWMHNSNLIEGAYMFGTMCSTSSYSLSFRKHFDVGKIIGMGIYNTASPIIPIYNINVLGDDAEFHYNNKSQFCYSLNFNIEHPESFKIINDSETPYIVVSNYNNMNYPAESDVKLNVEYGMQNEKKGQYSPTILTDEQLQRISNCATMAQVAELSTVIANKDN